MAFFPYAQNTSTDPAMVLEVSNPDGAGGILPARRIMGVEFDPAGVLPVRAVRIVGDHTDAEVPRLFQRHRASLGLSADGQEGLVAHAVDGNASPVWQHRAAGEFVESVAVAQVRPSLETPLADQTELLPLSSKLPFSAKL